MKRLVKAIRRLAAVAAIAAATLISALPAGAKLHYRGFVEGGIGITTVTGEENRLDNQDNGSGVALGYMLATTHGIQLKNHFLGLGLGITPGYTAIGKYYYNYKYTGSWSGWNSKAAIDENRKSKVSMPLYVNWRYDFFSATSSWNPYVGAKVGYFLPISEHHYSYTLHTQFVHSNGVVDPWETITAGVQSTGWPIFFSVDFGARKRISDRSGISFGLSLQSSNNAYLSGHEHYDEYNIYLSEHLGISILAKVAFDF